MEKLNTIQKRNNLNEVYVLNDEPKPDTLDIEYIISRDGKRLGEIQFQCGPRHESDSIHGVSEIDLLEIVRHRFQAHQKGPYATRENAIALTHIEEALLWINKRVEDRAERDVLGTNKI